MFGKSTCAGVKARPQWEALLLALGVLMFLPAAHAQNVTVAATNGLSCAGTRSGGTGSGCTANDFTAIVNFTNPNIANCVHGTTIPITFDVTVTSNNANRDDLGFFVGEQANDPQVNDITKTCSVTTFPSTPSPWFNDTGGTPNVCGDFTKNSTSVATVQNVHILCGPTAGQPLKVPYVLTYSIQNTACTGATDVNASPNSKCQGGANATAAVVTGVTVTPSADLSMQKSVAINGNAVVYTLVITNNGPDAADGATYSDNVPGTVSAISASCGTPTGGAVCGSNPSVAGNSVTGAVQTLPNSGSVTLTISGTGASNSSVSNTATVAAPNGTTDTVPANNTSTATGATLPVKLQSFDVVSLPGKAPGVAQQPH